VKNGAGSLCLMELVWGRNEKGKVKVKSEK